MYTNGHRVWAVWDAETFWEFDFKDNRGSKNDGSESKSAKIVADEVGISTKSATAIVNKIFKGDAANVPGVQKGFQSETPVGRDMSEINTDPDSGEALEAPF